MGKFREIIVKSIDLDAGNYINIANETKSITALDIYLVPKEGGEHERYVVDNNGLISKQSAGANGNFIPMKGIDLSKERITGALYQGNVDIDEYSSDNTYRIYSGGLYQGYYQNAEFRTNNEGQDQNMQERTISYGKAYTNSVSDISGTNYASIFEHKTVLLGDPNYVIGTYSSFPKYRNGIIQMNNNGVNMSFQSNSTFTGIGCGDDGLRFSGIPNAEGDPTFTHQIVRKENGVIGWQPKAVESGMPTLYPKVDILEYSDDTTNFYIKVTVSNIQKLGFLAQPYFEVATGSGGDVIAQGMTASYYNSEGGSKFSYTVEPFLLGGYHFILTIPKDQNPHGFWRSDGLMITVTWKGTDQMDGGAISPYKPRRLASDSKLIGDLRSKGGIPYSGTTPSNPITGTLDFGTTGLNGNLIKGVAGSTFSSLQLGADGRVQITSQSNMDRTYIQSFSDKVQIWGNGTGSSMISAEFGGINLNAPLGKSFSVKSTGIDIQGLNNATDDSTFTRQVVQRQDGVIGWQAKSEPIPIDLSGIPKIIGSAAYERQGNFAFITLHCSFYDIEASQEILIPVDGVFKTSLRTHQAFTDYSTFSPVNVRLITDISGIRIANTTNSSLDHFYIRETFVVQYGYDPGEN